MALSDRNLPPEHRVLIEEMAAVRERLSKWVQFHRLPTKMRVLRAAHHMSQRQLSRLSGVSQSQIALIEKGRSAPGTGTLSRLFSVLQCDLLIIPRLHRLPEKTLDFRALEKARRSVARSAAGKGQTEKVIEQLARAEAARLLKKPAALWDD